MLPNVWVSQTSFDSYYVIKHERFEKEDEKKRSDFNYYCSFFKIAVQKLY